MTGPFGKDMTFGGDASAFHILCQIENPEYIGEYLPARLSPSAIAYLLPQSENLSSMVLHGGQKIDVSLSCDALEAALQTYDANGKIDLNNVTGAEVAGGKLKSIFAKAVSGKRHGDAFKISFNGFSDASSAMRIIEISSADISSLSNSGQYSGHCYFSKRGGGLMYLRMSADLAGQFYAHAVACGAETLNLRDYTDKNNHLYSQLSRVQQLPPVYPKPAIQS